MRSVHIDLYAHDRAREVERLIGLGATRYPWRSPEHADYVVLEDPDGNLFGVVQVPSGVVEHGTIGRSSRVTAARLPPATKEG